jgi:hypothetical protein
MNAAELLLSMRPLTDKTQTLPCRDSVIARETAFILVLDAPIADVQAAAVQIVLAEFGKPCARL